MSAPYGQMFLGVSRRRLADAAKESLSFFVSEATASWIFLPSAAFVRAAQAIGIGPNRELWEALGKSEIRAQRFTWCPARFDWSSVEVSLGSLFVGY